MSSANSAPVSPAPGPATVRLALIRTSIEVFGLEATRESLFPTVCSMPLRIRPPERVAITPHVLRAYKMEEESWGTQILEAPISREMAHADGPLTIYLQVPEPEVEMWKEILQAVGYWGQASSVTWCTQLEEQAPILQECILPLHDWASSGPLGSFFSCILSEFRTPSLTWQDLLPLRETPLAKNVLRLDIYIWPLVLREQYGIGKWWILSPFSSLEGRGA